MSDERHTPEQKEPTASAAKRCRVCGEKLPEGAPDFPFCSKRCRMADLGKWFSGEYRISREVKDADLDAME
jgi:endogenous inhibitor of DNA gyrase (YacG/DUF329 family)